jgi:putative ABC transport system permease protein
MGLIQDVRDAVRALTKAPAFAIASILTLAIGIGANTAIYSLAQALIFTPVAIADPDRVVQLGVQIFSYRNFRDAPQHTSAYAGVAILHPSRVGVVRGDNPAIDAQALFVSPSYFSVLRVAPVAGRVLQEQDARAPGESPVVVLSHRAAVQYFGTAESAVGKAFTLGGRSVVVVGVTSKEFAGTDLAVAPDLFVPVTLLDALRPGTFAILPDRGAHRFDVIARLQPGVSLQQAAARIDEVTRPAWGSEQPRSYILDRTGPVPINEEALPDRQAVLNALNLLAAMVGIILLVACANVTSLFLSRMERRRTEFGVRLALGGSGIRLGRQLAVETLTLAGLGGLLAMLLAEWSIEALNALKLDTFLPAGGIDIDRTALVACAVLTLATAALCVAMPWLKALRSDPLVLLKASSGGTTGRDRRRVRAALVVGQIAAALVLTAGSGLLARSLSNQVAVDLGFDPSHVLLVRPNLTSRTTEEAEIVQQQLIERIRLLPDVRSVSLATSVPLSESGHLGLIERAGQEAVRTNLGYVSPDYFDALGIPLVAGRAFTPASGPEEVVVSESLAKLIAGESDPLGRRFTTNQGPQQIIGVVRDIKARDLKTSQVLFLYRRYGIRGGPYPGKLARLPAGGTIHIRSAGDPAELIQTVGALLRDIDPTAPLGTARLFRDHIDRWMAQSRSLVAVTGLFSVLALLLSAVGLYGLISQSVAAQLREIGIRMTLGAAPAVVRQRVLAQSAQLVGLGVVIGVFIVMSGAETLVGGLVFGVSPTDATAIAAASMTLLGVAMIASYIPARRAARVDPASVLRSE